MSRSRLVAVFFDALEYLMLIGSGLFLMGLFVSPVDLKYISAIIFVAFFALLKPRFPLFLGNFLIGCFLGGFVAASWSLVDRGAGWLSQWLFGIGAGEGFQLDLMFFFVYFLSLFIFWIVRIFWVLRRS